MEYYSNNNNAEKSKDYLYKLQVLFLNRSNKKVIENQDFEKVTIPNNNYSKQKEDNVYHIRHRSIEISKYQNRHFNSQITNCREPACNIEPNLKSNEINIKNRGDSILKKGRNLSFSNFKKELSNVAFCDNNLFRCEEQKADISNGRVNC